jgi:hypothetical protein
MKKIIVPFLHFMAAVFGGVVFLTGLAATITYTISSGVVDYESSSQSTFYDFFSGDETFSGGIALVVVLSFAVVLSLSLVFLSLKKNKKIKMVKNIMSLLALLSFITVGVLYLTLKNYIPVLDIDGGSYIQGDTILSYGAYLSFLVALLAALSETGALLFDNK